MLIKSTSFNVWVRYFVQNFKGTLWNSSQNILPMHWKIWFLYYVEILRALRFKSSYAFFKRPLFPYIRHRLLNGSDKGDIRIYYLGVFFDKNTLNIERFAAKWFDLYFINESNHDFRMWSLAMVIWAKFTLCKSFKANFPQHNIYLLPESQE